MGAKWSPAPKWSVAEVLQGTLRRPSVLDRDLPNKVSRARDDKNSCLMFLLLLFAHGCVHSSTRASAPNYQTRATMPPT